MSPLRETGLWFQVGDGESEAALATLRFGFSPVMGEGLVLVCSLIRIFPLGPHQPKASLYSNRALGEGSKGEGGS